MGHRHPDHAGRRRGHPHAAGLAVPGHRAAHRRGLGQLPRRLGAGGGKQCHAGARAAAQGHRRAAVFQVDEQLGRLGRDRRHLPPGHQPRHRPGAGAEQGQPGHQPPAAGGAAAGCDGREVAEQLPADRGPLRRDRPPHRHRRGRLDGEQPARSHQPRRRRGLGAGLRRFVRDAHLARSAPARELPADAL